ncbi:MAG: N-6 DNA methylase, partial [Chloroflexota bacterium]
MPKRPTPPESFRHKVEELVRKFEANKDYFLSPQYSESQARIDFIDELFEALGWKIRLQPDENPHERDVIVERGQTTGRPDYNFRLNKETKFFVEAKAPHIPIARSDVILQAKKYAWNTVSEIVYFAAVTDFQEFRFYDASRKPDPKHPDAGLIFAYHYDEYTTEKALADLWQLSREAVAAGGLEKLLKASDRTSRQRTPLDQQFLADLTTWREKFAKSIFKAHPDLTPNDLNSDVQVFLNRLIFMRIAEDRGALPANRLRDIARQWREEGKRRSIMADLLPLFREVNDDLNGEIFKQHPCDELQWDSALVVDIIENGLEPYNFAQIGVELLGSIYERYLGKTIRVTATRAVVEDKPEVRKAGGVFYTPKYVVDYIVENTVGALIEGKSPKQIEKIKIIDPACGSGSFLLGAYQYLLDYHLKWYDDHAPKQVREQREMYGAEEGGKRKLSIEEKSRILKNNLFGIDLDPQAAEITMMSLYIKMLEGERNLPHKKAVLPLLGTNIKCGNSLIGPDAYKQPELFENNGDRVRVFDWESEQEGFGKIMINGGFDAVIGNPPWGADIDDHLPYFHDKYPASTQEHTDSFKLFIEAGLHKVRPNGLMGMIVPNTLLRQRRIKDVRSLLLQHQIHSLIDLGENVFKGVVAPSCIVMVSKAKPKSDQKVNVYNLSKLSNDDKEAALAQGSPVKIFVDQYTFQDNADLEFAHLAKKTIVPTLSLGDFGELECKDAGINYQRVKVGMQVKGKSDLAERLLYEGKRQKAGDQMYWKGTDIDRYWVAEKTGRFCRTNYADFIHRNEVVHLNGDVFNIKPKILLRQTADRVIATIDYRGIWFGRSVIAVVLTPKASHQIEYFLGLLNSRYFEWLYQELAQEKGRAFAQVKLSKLKQLPIRAIDFANSVDKDHHDQIVAWVKIVTDLTKQKASADNEQTTKRLNSEVNAISERIDKLV